MLWLRWHGEASSTYYRSIPEAIQFHPLAIFGMMEDLLFESSRITEKLPLLSLWSD